MINQSDTIRDGITSSLKQRIHHLSKKIDKLVIEMLHDTNYRNLILTNHDKRKV